MPRFAATGCVWRALNLARYQFGQRPLGVVAGLTAYWGVGPLCAESLFPTELTPWWTVR